jgi:PKHD-type hydroxylase
MLLTIPDVLSVEQIDELRASLQAARWLDGRVTAGHQSLRAKHNLQLAQGDPLACVWGERIVAALERQPLFLSAALPLKVYPPLFNRYDVGQGFGAHIDNAVRQVAQGPLLVRTDLSATLFLSAPEDYEGGELVIEDTYGVHSVKLPAGQLVLYPAASLHHVRPVTRGTRLASFFWIQSMVRDDGQRTLLFDLDNAVRALSVDTPEHPGVLQLTGVYHNLLRRWADV